MRHAFLPLLTGLALVAAACSGSGNDSDSAHSAEAPAPLRVEATPDGLWVSTPSHLGPISANTPYTLDALQGVLPGFHVVAAEAYAEGMAYPVFEARRDAAGPAELMLDGDSSILLAIRIRAPGLVDGVADIGDTAAAAGFVHGDCFPGVEERAGDVVCPDPRGNGLSYWIAVDHDGPDGDLPPDAAINAGQIYELNWLPAEY